MRKRKYWLSMMIILCVLTGYLFYNSQLPDGSTIESRTEILNNTPKGVGWKIVTEREFEGYLLCGAISSDDKVGIMVFEPTKKGYRLYSREWRPVKDKVILSGVTLNGAWYTLAWLYGIETALAEFTYISDEDNIIVEQYAVDHGEIVYSLTPFDDYFLEVLYYDAAGNCYE